MTALWWRENKILTSFLVQRFWGVGEDGEPERALSPLAAYCNHPGAFKDGQCPDKSLSPKVLTSSFPTFSSFSYFTEVVLHGGQFCFPLPQGHLETSKCLIVTTGCGEGGKGATGGGSERRMVLVSCEQSPEMLLIILYCTRQRTVQGPMVSRPRNPAWLGWLGPPREHGRDDKHLILSRF